MNVKTSRKQPGKERLTIPRNSVEMGKGNYVHQASGQGNCDSKTTPPPTLMLQSEDTA